ncbi:NH(3)-dependent NAD(+) synthetase [Methanococcoides vulcani]|uniref:NH(3)-dependent NAD(+) synthetase n=1 Tax=Methanococcoides vulcani TaxID=1353158 RepID=A0A1I0B0X4_9EURY|nr:NAD(+) synthase [Methanococcoides vulcani]SET00324.1 NH(3)-dependent NAD(+) synthetase [Methanococcoides vulcani]
MKIIDELNKDAEKNASQIRTFIEEKVKDFKKKGIVVGVSGGIDSAVILALAVQAVGKENVYGLILPETESASSSKELGARLCESLDVSYEEVPITPILQALDIYGKKDQIIKRTCLEYDPNIHKTSLVLPSLLENDMLTIPSISLVKDDEMVAKNRLKAKDYLELIGIQNVKQRSRMLIQYLYAEKNNYLVCGTTNKTEYLLGQFVKYGDGGVDIEPLSDCYKTQVYALADVLGIDKEIIERPPSADTWSSYTSDEDFFWRMPIHIMDQLLYSQEHDLPMEIIEENTELSEETINKAKRGIDKIKSASKYITSGPPICYLDK